MSGTTKRNEMKFTVIAALVIACGLAGADQANSASPQIISATPSVERAIQIRWQSESNTIYRIDFAPQLNNSNTQWQTLYDDYPSHGTNSFIADAGNYDLVPEVPHPQFSPMRFYRITRTGTNTSPNNPSVSIFSPTNGASLSGDVTMGVSSASSEILSEVKLYIDGEEQRRSDDGTNFLINTCEWPNGPHTIFATAKSQSTMEGLAHDNHITYGMSVSEYVNVTFDNLITRFDFSEPFFEPSEGQTQKVTAMFAANVDWTLEIQDVNGYDVRYVAGSGASLEFYWDGTGTNGASIPDGIYTYLLTVNTNGAPLPSPGGGTGGGPPPAPAYARLVDGASVDGSLPSSPMQAMLAGLPSFFLVPPPMPPLRVDGQWHSWAEIYGPTMSIEVQIPLQIQESFLKSLSAGVLPGANPNEKTGLIVAGASSAIGFGAGPEFPLPPSPQTTRGPKRKPRVGVKNKSGTIGICYKTYGLGYLSQAPRTGMPYPLQPFVAIDNKPAGPSLIDWASLASTKPTATSFAELMKIGGFKAKFIKPDDQWGPLDIQKASLGGSNIFNSCDFGLLLTHGCYGTTSEIDGVKYTYLPLYDEKHGSSYVRLSDMDFGSAQPGHLKWMTILSCNVLRPANVTSMANHSMLPINENLHLLLAPSTTMYGTPWLGVFYASNLVMNVTIWNSFANAGISAYSVAARSSANRAAMTNTVTFRAMGPDSCVNDSLFIFNEPDPNASFQILDQTVYTPSP
jgi:hypothetical protein